VLAKQRVGKHSEMKLGPNKGAYPYGNSLVVSGSGTVVQIDAGLGDGDLGADLILLSHYHEDHVVGVGKSGVNTSIHGKDIEGVTSWPGFLKLGGYDGIELGAEMLEPFDWAPVDAVPFGDDAVFDLGGSISVRVIPLPGHTPGHCGFFVEPDGVLYIGDIDLSSFGPSYGDATSSLSEFRRSLATVRTIDAAAYVTFHHKGHLFDAVEFRRQVTRYTDVLDQREARIGAQCLRRGSGWTWSRVRRRNAAPVVRARNRTTND